MSKINQSEVVSEENVRLRGTVAQLEKRIKELEPLQSIENLAEVNKALTTRVEDIKADVDGLLERNAVLNNGITTLEEQNKKLTDEAEALRAENARLVEEGGAIKTELEELKKTTSPDPLA